MLPLTRSRHRARFFGDASTLEFDFISASALDSRITFTRASSATRFSSSGVLETVGNDVARLDFNPATLAAQGLLIEEQRTNSIRNNTMVGAAAGTPGTLPTNWFAFTTLTGLTSQVVGTGTENGITYIDFRLSGTPSAAGAYLFGPEQSTQIAASNSQTWTASTYVKLVGGSLTGVSFDLVVTERSAGGELARSSQVFTPTSAVLSSQRITVTRTNNNASTAFELPFVQFNLTGVAIDITLRIGLPQLEQGAFATSVIPTTTTALTRSADVASVNTLTPWFNAAAGTLFVESSRFALGSSGQFVVAEFGSTVSNNDNIIQLGTQFATTSFQFLVNTGGVTQVALVEAGTTAVAKYAFAYNTNDFAYTKNGAVPLTDTSGSVPTVVQLNIGSRPAFGNTSFLNGHIRRLAYYARPFAGAQLQALTA